MKTADYIAMEKYPDVPADTVGADEANEIRLKERMAFAAGYTLAFKRAQRERDFIDVMRRAEESGMYDG